MLATKEHAADLAALGHTSDRYSPTGVTMIETDCAELKFMNGRETLEHLERDLQTAGNLYGWMYLLNSMWTENLLRNQADNVMTRMIVDHRMKATAAELQSRSRRFEAWSWSYNRTMHDKTLFFPVAGLIYIGTHNMTKGSYWLSENRSIRIKHHRMTQELLRQWQNDREHAKKVVNSK